MPRTLALFFALAACTAGPLLAQTATTPPASADADLVLARSKGNPTAPIRVVEMSDFQCPWCRKFTVETAGALDSEYVATGKVRWLFLNLPIPQLHPNAVTAAELAMCSAERGKFWAMHDLLYRNQDRWAPLRDPEPYLLTLIDSLRIPRDSILPCLREGKMRDLVARDAAIAGRVGAHSTPTFLIDGIMVGGAYPVEVFRHILDSLYTVRTAARSR